MSNSNFLCDNIVNSNMNSPSIDTKSDKNDSVDINDINDEIDLSIENKQFLEKKTIVEIQKISKNQTENELINLGKQMNDIERKKDENNINLKKATDIITPYKKMDTANTVDTIIKHKKYIELKEFFDSVLLYEKIMTELIQEKDKKILLLNNEVDDLTEDNSKNTDEIFELEDKIDNHWTTRVTKLRSNLVRKNKLINYIYIGWGVSIFHTFIFTYYGFEKYFNFWYSVFSITYNVIRFIVLLIPNAYEKIKNYKYVYTYVVKNLKMILYLLKNTFNYLKNNIYSLNNIINAFGNSADLLRNKIYSLSEISHLFKNNTELVKDNLCSLKDNTHLLKNNMTSSFMYTYIYMKDNLKLLCNIININCITFFSFIKNNLFRFPELIKVIFFTPIIFIKNKIIFIYEGILNIIEFCFTNIIGYIFIFSFLKTILWDKPFNN